MDLVYGLLKTCSTEEREYAYIDAPAGAGLDAEMLAKLKGGTSVASSYPADAHAVRSSRFGGSKWGDFVSNIWGLLVVSERVKDVLQRVNRGDAEYLPLAIRDAKRKRYFIVNPLGGHDVLDKKASRPKEWDALTIDKEGVFVLDAKKVQKAPDLFRIAGHSQTYVISKKIATELRALVPEKTNLHYLDIYELEA